MVGDPCNFFRIVWLEILLNRALKAGLRPDSLGASGFSKHRANATNCALVAAKRQGEFAGWPEGDRREPPLIALATVTRSISMAASAPGRA
jgi:hypothetical protein